MKDMFYAEVSRGREVSKPYFFQEKYSLYIHEVYVYKDQKNGMSVICDYERRGLSGEHRYLSSKNYKVETRMLSDNMSDAIEIGRKAIAEKYLRGAPYENDQS